MDSHDPRLNSKPTDGMTTSRVEQEEAPLAFFVHNRLMYIPSYTRYILIHCSI